MATQRREQGDGDRPRTVRAVVSAVRLVDGALVSRAMDVPVGLPGFASFLGEIRSCGYRGLALRRVAP